LTQISKNKFPDNRKFAFTILDDTDLSTIDNVGPIYQLLAELGMRTTKSVWPLASVPEGRQGGDSLQEADYLRFVLDLQTQGFEISLHNVRNHDATREMIDLGLEEYRKLVGSYPRIQTNHSTNRDNIYWGAARFNRLKLLYKAGTALQDGHTFEGHNPDTAYFWGDLCRERVEYVRNFVFREINLDRVNPTMPYHDESRPFVNNWFSSCRGGNVDSFCEMLSEANQERLEDEGGVCIMYVHFACGFVTRGAVHPRVEELLRRMAGRNGWFAPVSTVLDFLRKERKGLTIPSAELTSMEQRWAFDKAALLMGRVFPDPQTLDYRSRQKSHAPSY
jgi:hypothetical protein